MIEAPWLVIEAPWLVNGGHGASIMLACVRASTPGSTPGSTPDKSASVLYTSTSSASTDVLCPMVAVFHGQEMISGTRVPSSKLVNFSLNSGRQPQ
eukprot:COSAG01_NODE_9173_length_2529_cov_8.300000_2_plen_96_part_00